MMSSVRRAVIVAALPVTRSSARPIGAQTAPLASWNDGPAKQAILTFVRATTDRSSPQFVAARRADRHLRQRRHAVGRAAVVYPGRLRARSRRRAGAAASRSGRPPSRSSRCSRVTRRRSRSSPKRTSRRSSPRRIPGMTVEAFNEIVANWLADRHGQAIQAALHRAGVSADARAPLVSARERLQDLHRHRRRPGLRARLRAERSTASRSSRSSAPRARRSSRTRRMARRSSSRRPRSCTSTTRRASRKASTSSSAAAHGARSATPTATCRCSSGPRRAAARD